MSLQALLLIKREGGEIELGEKKMREAAAENPDSSKKVEMDYNR